jgi:magnesium chelatase subunit I
MIKQPYVYQTLWVSYPLHKVELVYEGEQEGAAYVAQNLIASFYRLLPKIEKLEKPDAKKRPYTLIEWFC